MDAMKVLFCQPLSVRNPPALPAGFELLAVEGRLLNQAVQRTIFRRLWQRRGQADVLVIGRYGEWFSMFQGMLPFGRKPLIFLDVEWSERHEGSLLRRWRSQVGHWLSARGASKLQVFCAVEADNYAAHFGIPRDKFVWIPYCTDITAERYAPAEEEYIFTGGNNQRDFATLREAVRGLPIKVRVAASREQFDTRFDTEQFDFLGMVPPERYYTEMARARLVVLSLQPHVLRCPGVITYVQAMRFGKCVIVNEPLGACSYIQNGETGVLVPSQDPARLRSAIGELWENHDRRRRLAAQAHDHAARHFCLARYLRDVERLAYEVSDSSGSSAAA